MSRDSEDFINMEKIDFVLLWVDGSDPAWLEEKNKYSDVQVNVSASAARYRDWDNLQYWFRGVEKYAPWVNKIFFITWGHLPKWLNINHPKLQIVRHEESWYFIYNRGTYTFIWLFNFF